MLYSPMHAGPRRCRVPHPTTDCSPWRRCRGGPGKPPHRRRRTMSPLTFLVERPRAEAPCAGAILTGPTRPGREALAAEDVTVIYGSRVQAFALAGMTVSHAVDVVGPTLGVEPGRPALVNGEQVWPGRRLAVNDALELVRVAGEKG